jgi:hypothetical protein
VRLHVILVVNNQHANNAEDVHDATDVPENEIAMGKAGLGACSASTSLTLPLTKRRPYLDHSTPSTSTAHCSLGKITTSFKKLTCTKTNTRTTRCTERTACASLARPRRRRSRAPRLRRPRRRPVASSARPISVRCLHTCASACLFVVVVALSELRRLHEGGRNCVCAAPCHAMRQRRLHYTLEVTGWPQSCSQCNTQPSQC